MSGHDRGFTLLEVLVALTVASMAAVVSFTVFLIPLRTLILDGYIVRGKGVAERALLEAMARPCEWEGEREDTVTDEGAVFERTVEVRVFPGVELWRFSVQTRWSLAGRRYQTSIVHHHAYYGLRCPQWVYPYERR